MKKLLLITAIAALSATTFAEDATTKYNFTEVDANIDGMISLEEAVFYPGLATAFVAVDSDADGQLSEVEFVAMDTDEDGLLSMEELGM